uniref:Uncharacterized protein n=1 Tax=Sphaerodactylus townsendi TaxID=933632 RepID=A0ACB8G856_9SAUR
MLILLACDAPCSTTSPVTCSCILGVTGQEGPGGPQREDGHRRVVIHKTDAEEAEEVPPEKPEDVGAAEGSELLGEVPLMQAKKSKPGEPDSGSEASLVEADFESVDNSSLLSEANFPAASQEGPPLLPLEGRAPSPGAEIRQRSVCSSS